MSDGSGPGTYVSLAQVFRDCSFVWLEIRIGAEFLAPRTRLDAVPYALNASHVGGLGSGQFLRGDASSSLTQGILTINPGAQLHVNGSLMLDADGPDESQYLFFFDDGIAGNEAFFWNDAPDRFEASNDFYASNVRALSLGFEGPDRST